jgi:hypothetical protein
MPLVNDHDLQFDFDSHGEKHFSGNGTRFTQGKGVVNPALINLIRPHIGRIRRDAKGRTQTYYLTAPPQVYTGGRELRIQADYIFGRNDKIVFHGYPCDVTAFTLSRTIAGPPIPP